jgi:hypothetical protein
MSKKSSKKQTPEQKLEALLNEKRLAPVKELERELLDGLHNYNPLKIGQRLYSIRKVFGCKLGERGTPQANNWSLYLKVRVFGSGLKKATVYRYTGAWEKATSLYPEAFVEEMASHIYTEPVSEDKPFGKYTKSVATQVVKLGGREKLRHGKIAETAKAAIESYTRPEPKKQDYLNLAYKSVLNNLSKYLAKIYSGGKATLKSDMVVDAFLKELAPQVLAGCGLAVGFKTEPIKVVALNPNYEAFTVPVEKVETPKAKKTGKRGSKKSPTTVTHTYKVAIVENAAPPANYGVFYEEESAPFTLAKAKGSLGTEAEMNEVRDKLNAKYGKKAPAAATAATSDASAASA